MLKELQKLYVRWFAVFFILNCYIFDFSFLIVQLIMTNFMNVWHSKALVFWLWEFENWDRLHLNRYIFFWKIGINVLENIRFERQEENNLNKDSLLLAL